MPARPSAASEKDGDLASWPYYPRYFALPRGNVAYARAMRLLLCFVVLAAVGCEKSNANGTAAPSASAQTTPTASVAASASSAPAIAGPRKVAAVGDIPAWSA